MDLIYHMKLVNLNASDVDQDEFSLEMRDRLTSNACGQHNYVKFLRAGGTLVIAYRASGGELLAKIRVPPSLCGF